MKTVVVEWDDDAEDYEEVFTPESEAEFWAERSRLNEERFGPERPKQNEESMREVDPLERGSLHKTKE
jgi:hypothetical protein